MPEVPRLPPLVLNAALARGVAMPVWVFGLFLTAAMFGQIAAPAFSDARHRIAPTDFSAFWAAARLAASGSPQAAYDSPSMQAAQCVQAACDPAAPFPRPFLYPPIFLLLCLPLGLLPLAVALPAFVAAGYMLLAVLLRRLAGVGWWAPILLSPGALLDAVSGQAGFFTASCFAGGLLLIGTRPAIAGACLGLLVIKPQLAIGIPVALLAARRWRALAACAATALAACALSWAVLGQAAWLAFFERSRTSASLLLDAFVWHRMVSVFGAARLLRVGIAPAAAAQAVAAVLALAWLARLARRRADDGADIAALVPAALLCTPYLWDYDLVCLGVPSAWLAGRAARTGWRAWEKPVLCAAYLLPVLARFANVSLGVPLAPFVAAAMLTLIAMRSVAVLRR